MIWPTLWNHQESLPKADLVLTIAHSSPACFHVMRWVLPSDLDIKRGLDIKDLEMRVDFSGIQQPALLTSRK